MLRTVFLAAAMLAAASSAHAVQVFFDDFESDTISAGDFDVYGSGSTDGPDLVKWTILQGNVDIVSSSAFPCAGNQCIDVDGTGSPAPLIMQTKATFSANLGDKIFISFTYFGTNSGDFDPFVLSFGGLGIHMHADLFLPQTFNIGPFSPRNTIVDQPLILEVLEAPNNFGPFIDNIGLEIVSQPIPVPATALLLASGVAGLAGMRARRKK